MLFDLRGRGRRRTVKVVYVTLALLMGGGLVLFGIGGDGAAGGLVDAITGALAAATTGSERFAHRKERDARRATRGDPRTRQPGPRSPAPASRRAGIGDNFDPSTGAYTDQGQAEARATPARRVGDATSRSTDEARRPRRQPDGAGLRPVGLNRPADAAAAQEIITEARPHRERPTPSSRSTPTRPGQTRKGDLARDKALELAAHGRARRRSRASSTRPSSRPSASAATGPGRSATPAADRDARAAKQRLPSGRPRPCSSTGRAADS